MLEVLLFFAMMAAILLVLALMVGWGELVAWRERVKSYREIMSRAVDDIPAITASSLGTDAPRTQDGQAAHKIRGEELLTLYQLMRRYNIPRDEAQAALKASNLPMSNGTWAKAAPPPPEEPPQVTPIAGRPTRAHFHDDPDLVFQPPPR